MCNPVPGGSGIVEWSAIERCRSDYPIERVHLESEQIRRQYVKGRMGTAAGFDWLLAQNVRTHTAGSFAGGAAIAVDGAAQTGSSLNMKGFTASSANVA